MFFVSPGVVMIVPWRRRRFLFGDFLVRMWLLNALMRFTLPEPVILNLLRAPLWDFIFGIAVPFICRSRLKRRAHYELSVDLPRRYLGARIIVMNFPSNFGSLSIFDTSASS